MELILLLAVIGWLCSLGETKEQKELRLRKAQWDVDHLNRYDVL